MSTRYSATVLWQYTAVGTECFDARMLWWAQPCDHSAVLHCLLVDVACGILLGFRMVPCTTWQTTTLVRQVPLGLDKSSAS